MPRLLGRTPKAATIRNVRRLEFLGVLCAFARAYPRSSAASTYVAALAALCSLWLCGEMEAMRKFESAVLGYTTLRLAIGMAMLIHGVTRITNISVFTQVTLEQFSKTWMPEFAVTTFAHLTPPIELTIGALVIVGLFTRLALTAGGLWMVALIFGSTLIEQYNIVAIQLLYSLIFFVLLRDAARNELSLDRFIWGMKDPS